MDINTGPVEVEIEEPANYIESGDELIDMLQLLNSQCNRFNGKVSDTMLNHKNIVDAYEFWKNNDTISSKDINIKIY